MRENIDQLNRADRDRRLLTLQGGENVRVWWNGYRGVDKGMSGDWGWVVKVNPRYRSVKINFDGHPRATGTWGIRNIRFDQIVAIE
jgi:hypothetical protein